MAGEQIDHKEIIVKRIYTLDSYNDKYWSDLISLSNILFKDNKVAQKKVREIIDEILEMCYDGRVDKSGKPIFPDFFQIQSMVQKRNPKAFFKLQKPNGWGYTRVYSRDISIELEKLKWTIFDEIGNTNIRFRDSTLNVIK